MTCPTCHTWNLRDYKFCRECGGNLEAAVPLDPDAAPALAGRTEEDPAVQQLLEQAFGYMDAGQHQDALSTAQAALAIRPASTAAHSVLAVVYERQGKLSDAVQQLEIVLQLDP